MSGTKPFHLAVVLITTIVLASCKGPSSTEGPGGNVLTSPDSAPSWINGSHALFPYSKYITGTGCATGSFSKRVVDQARLNARANISETISSKIRSEIRIFSREIIENNRFDFNQDMWTRSFSESELVLNGSRFPVEVGSNPYYNEKSGTLFVFAVLDRMEAADNIVNRMGNLLTDMESVLERGEAALESGDVPTALRTFREVLDKLPPDSGELFTAWFLVNDHPGVRKLANVKRNMAYRAQVGLDAVTATLVISVTQGSEYLSREEGVPARVIVKTSLTPPGGRPVPAAGVPLALDFSGGPNPAQPSERTGMDGTMTTIFSPADRTVPLTFTITVTPNAAELAGDGLHQDHAEQLSSRASAKKAIHFRPQLSRKVLVSAVVTINGEGVGKEQIKTLLEEIVKFLTACAASADTDTDPLSSVDPSPGLAGLSAARLSEKLRLKGRILCRGSVEIETVNPGAASAIATWKGLDLIDLREGKVLVSGYLKGEKGKGQYGANEYDAAGRSLKILFDELKDRIGRKIDEHCREK